MEWLKFQFLFLLLCLNGYNSIKGEDIDPPLIQFLENKGQFPSQVKYAARLQSGAIFFENNRMIYNFYNPEQLQHKGHEIPNKSKQSRADLSSDYIDFHAYSMNFLNACQTDRIMTGNPDPGVTNFFVGKKSEWGTNVKSYKELSYPEIYTGIDLKIYSKGVNIKYDFIVQPHNDPNQIVLEYEGVTSIELKNGNLYIKTTVNELIEFIPEAWQNIDGKKIKVACSYSLKGNKVSFVFPEGYNNDKQLVIDPILIFSTYSGSTADNWGNTATYDDSGNLYSGGISQYYFGLSYPTTIAAYQKLNRGIWDVAITKFDSLGNYPIYSTYLGGGGSEIPQSMVVTKDNELIVMGITGSSNFPVLNTSYDTLFNGGVYIDPLGVDFFIGTDIFITKFNASGNDLLGSTFLGGSQNDGIMMELELFGTPLVKNYGDQSRGDVYLDENGDIYVASKTLSPDFPVLNGPQSILGGKLDAVLVKFEGTLSSLIWSTYIGGSDDDAAYSVKTNSLGQTVVAGGTNSLDIQLNHPNFTNLNSGYIDAWVAIISSDGKEIIRGKYVGTSLYEQAYFIDLDLNDNIYLYGQSSGNYPIQGNVYNFGDGQFIHKFSSDLTLSLFSTEFGSENNSTDISPTAFLVNDCFNIYVSGWGGGINHYSPNYIGGNTFNMPITIDAYQSDSYGNDFYLAVFIDDMGDLLYSTYLGGPYSRTHVDGGTSRFDKKGIVYHAVCSGCVSGNVMNQPTSDFPTTVGVWSNSNNSMNCNNASFKFDLSSLRAKFQTNNLEGTEPGYNKICIPDEIVFDNQSVGGETFYWDFGDGFKVVTSDTADIVHSYLNPGKYKVKLKIVDLSTCSEVDSTFSEVDVFVTNFSVVEDSEICEGDKINISASGGVNYLWTNGNRETISKNSSFDILPDKSSLYYVNITDQNGCMYSDS
ncbi:MAG: PKD domain-containing protein, partial [Cyclobacteriaceae bacterium]|nr:PKD domain-containing protein [Cyclobacteriaceae bacterium]